MISKKENLLTRPWQQRKFENHRQKVNLYNFIQLSISTISNLQ